MAMASLHYWDAGGYFTNKWFPGTIADNKFKVEDGGLLDYGQFYAARTSNELQAPDGRRVRFSATGCHNPPRMGACRTQLYLIPRDIKLGAPKAASPLNRSRRSPQRCASLARSSSAEAPVVPAQQRHKARASSCTLTALALLALALLGL